MAIASRTDTPAHGPRSNYTPGPRLEDVAAGSTQLQRGHSGPQVRWLQNVLNQAGARPPLALDGLFGPKTEAALQRLQSARAPSAQRGVLDMATLVMLAQNMGWGGGGAQAGNRATRGAGARTAPRFGQSAPAGSVPARSLATSPSVGGTRRGANPGAALQVPGSSLSQVRGAGGDTPADRDLADIQARGLASAQRELQAGVREQGGANRGPRVDEYARRSRMRPGEWCGFFVGFNLSEGARATGGEFEGINGLHSMQKGRAFFEYRSYTNNSRATNDRLDALRESHAAQGSTRRWMTLSGSGGQRHAAARNRPHEVFEPNTLPIRPGDVAIFGRGHLGMVESYDQSTGRLTTVEGNVGNRVQRKTYDLNNPRDRARFEGFGRPARGDFSGSSAAPTQPGPGVPNTPESPATAPAPAADPAPAAAPARAPSTAPTAAPLATLPARPADAPTGSEFLARTAQMSRADREEAVLQEVLSGNVPDSLRQMRPVTLTGRGADGRAHTAEIMVAPDYLAIGSDEDSVRIPMTPRTAQRIADATGASLPTSKMVDAIYRGADQRLTPQPIPPSPQMMSNGVFAQHEALVDGQVARRGTSPGALIAGHKKDVVLSERLATRPDKVAIYGWHQTNGQPIQPLSTLHERSYADYSHGVRLVSDKVKVDGQWRDLQDVLRDPNLAPVLSAEGPLSITRAPTD